MGGGGVIAPERTRVEDGLDSRKQRIVGILGGGESCLAHSLQLQQRGAAP